MTRLLPCLVLSLYCASSVAQPVQESSASAPKPPPQKVRTTKARSELVIGTDLACSLKVDDSDTQNVSPDEPLILRVSPGEHLITAISQDGQDRWSKVIDVDKPKKAVMISLSAVKQERESYARGVAQQLNQAKEQARAAQMRAAGQAARQRQIEELEAQIRELRDDAETSAAAADNFDQEAQVLQSGAGASAAQYLAAQKRNEVQRINRQIADLQQQIEELRAR